MGFNKSSEFWLGFNSEGQDLDCDTFFVAGLTVLDKRVHARESGRNGGRGGERQAEEKRKRGGEGRKRMEVHVGFSSKLISVESYFQWNSPRFSSKHLHPAHRVPGTGCKFNAERITLSSPHLAN